MTMPIALTHRGILRVSGEERVAFLQGLLTNDVTAVDAGTSCYAALLTPQGKILHDLIVADGGDGALLLDIEAARLPDLLQRLGRYRLRAKVAFEDVGGAFEVLALPEGDPALGLSTRPGASVPCRGGVAMVDPRHPALGLRLIVPRGGGAAGGFEVYDRLRLERGVPDGVQDCGEGAMLALEANLDALNGVSWTKGCYVGQEVTARSRYRSLIRRRLWPVRVDGPLPGPGTPVTSDGREVGEVRSGRDDLALAVLRTELISGAASPLMAGAARLTLLSPIWETSPDA